MPLIRNAELKAQQLIPIATDIAPELGPYVYNVLDTVGEAKVIASGSDDLPRVDVSVTVLPEQGHEIFLTPRVLSQLRELMNTSPGVQHAM